MHCRLLGEQSDATANTSIKINKSFIYGSYQSLLSNYELLTATQVLLAI